MHIWKANKATSTLTWVTDEAVMQQYSGHHDTGTRQDHQLRQHRKPLAYQEEQQSSIRPPDQSPMFYVPSTPQPIPISV